MKTRLKTLFPYLLRTYTRANANTGSFASLMVRLLIVTITLTALLLLGLLAIANANTAFFDRYYSLLYAANVAVAVVFLLIVSSLIVMIITRLKQRKFGMRLVAKLAIFFALVGVLPGSIIYLISLQFVSRSIESWFDINVETAVETALESGLSLGRGMLNSALADLRNKGQLIADRLSVADSANLTLALSRLRDQFDVQNAAVVSSTGTVLAQASAYFDTLDRLLPNDVPTPLMLRQARIHSEYAAVEGQVEDEGQIEGGKIEGSLAPAERLLKLRVVIKIPAGYQTTLRDNGLFLQLIQPLEPALAHDAQDIQRGYRLYQEKAFGRTGLRKMYIGTLTLALFFATFIAMMLAFVLGNQLARPLLLLVKGIKEVARGNFAPKGEIHTHDELGFLTQSFNAMTRQLLEARAAVERNRIALENSNTYLESILSNLTTGVFVFDRQFRLTKANPGAARIFHQPFDNLPMPVDQITGLNEFGTMVRKAFADCDANNSAWNDISHWQRQWEIPVAGEMAGETTSSMTLLVRGTRLTYLTVPTNITNTKKGTVKNAAETTGYVVVFDDISEIISAQRSRAWGEVARRLAHEIKNPLTPIQLSTERLQMKLDGKLTPTDAQMLKRSTATIISQVAAMKQMVDDFREYARTPSAVLQSLQLNDLIAEVLTLYGVEEGKSQNSQSSQSAIQLNLAPLPEIHGDPTQLRQVIHNLLQNAQDAVAEVASAHILIETKTVKYDDPDAPDANCLAVRLAISDNGPGFPSHLLAGAFEPYVTTKAKGTGLGLATVKKIIDEHAAHIHIRNRVKEEETEVIGAQISILFLQLADKARQFNANL